MALATPGSVIHPIGGSSYSNINSECFDHLYLQPRRYGNASSDNARSSASCPGSQQANASGKLDCNTNEVDYHPGAVNGNHHEVQERDRNNWTGCLPKVLSLPVSTPVPAPPPPPALTSSTCVAVVGVGFVGASLLQELAAVFPNAVGYDVCPARLKHLQETVFSENIDRYKNLQLTQSEQQLRSASYFFIAVPTLLGEGSKSSTHQAPTWSTSDDFVRRAISTVLCNCRPGSVIIIESSVSVGTTRALLEPYAEYVYGGTSPERVDPGRTSPPPALIPKLVAGLTETATTAIAEIYRRCYTNVISVSSPEVAEMTKLYENCFRMVNIAYANEAADACKSLDIDFKEVLTAAGTKPYGFMPFVPGPGVGGHCLPVNPYYMFGSCGKGNFPVLKQATKIMEQRPGKLAMAFYKRVAAEMVKRQRLDRKDGGRKTLPRVLVVGVGFKAGSAVSSHSPGLAFAATLGNLGCCRLAYYDPLVDTSTLKGDAYLLEKLADGMWSAEYLAKEFDAVAVCVRQHGVDWSVLEEMKKYRHCLLQWYV